MAHKFHMWKDKRGETRVAFMYNGEKIWTTEGYSSKAAAKNAVESILKNGPTAEIVDEA